MKVKLNSAMLMLAIAAGPLAAAENCSTLTDKTAVLAADLAADNHAVIPAGEIWPISELTIGSGQKISGEGAICKPSTAKYALLVDGEDITIQDLRFTPQTVSGQPNCDIKLAEGSKDVRISNNHFSGNSYSAVCAADDTAVGGSAYSVPAQGIMLNDNTFSGYVRPVYLHSVDNITIENNILRDSKRDAIRLRENDGFALIIGNQFFNIGDGAIATETQDAIDTYWGGNRLVISNNVIRTTQSMGLDIKGVSPSGGDVGSRSVIISNNHISDTLYSGIVLHGNLDTGEVNHTILVEGNIIEGATRNQSYADAAIWVKGMVKYLTIADNQLRSNYARGITIQTRSRQNDGTVAGVHVIGNQLINNGVASAASSIGLYMNGVQGAIVSNNTVGNDSSLDNPTTRYGIYATNIQDGIFKDNILRCNANNQITVSGSNIINSDNLISTVTCN